jgi:Tetratricopeptide repeat
VSTTPKPSPQPAGSRPICASWANQQARALDEDTLARRRRVLGDNHPDTLTSVNNLAADLCAMGKPDKV